MKYPLDEFEYVLKLQGKAASTVKLYKEQLVASSVHRLSKTKLTVPIGGRWS